MFGFMVSLAKSHWQLDFVEASNIHFSNSQWHLFVHIHLFYMVILTINYVITLEFSHTRTHTLCWIWNKLLLHQWRLTRKFKLDKIVFLYFYFIINSASLLLENKVAILIMNEMACDCLIAIATWEFTQLCNYYKHAITAGHVLKSCGWNIIFLK